MDWDAQPEIVQQAWGYALQGWEVAQGWLSSPAAWAQFGVLIGSYLLALLLNRKLKPWLGRILTPGEDQTGVFASIRSFLLIFVPLLLPLLAFGFTGLGETVTRSVFDSGAVIAFGKRVPAFGRLHTRKGYHRRPVSQDPG